MTLRVCRITSAICLTLLVRVPSIIAQTTATAPTTATSAPAPYRLVVPAGFVKVTANDRAALVESAETAWAREALTQTPPATRPSPMPADIAAKITALKPELARQIPSDLGTVNPADVETLLQDQVLPRVQK